jgi:hypothetical protein
MSQEYNNFKTELLKYYILQLYSMVAGNKQMPQEYNSFKTELLNPTTVCSLIYLMRYCQLWKVNITKEDITVYTVSSFHSD